MFVRTYVRAYVRTSRWKIWFTPYLVVELSPSAELWYVYVTSISDGTQISTFLGIHHNRDFLNSRFFCGNLNILNCSKGALTPNWDDVRTYVHACVRAYATLENIVHSISRGRTVTKCWNLVCVCNKYQWWYWDLNIPGNSQQSRFSELSSFLWNLINLPLSCIDSYFQIDCNCCIHIRIVHS